jgi:hypothetical protein
MKKLMTHGILISGTLLLGIASSALAAEKTVYSKEDRYRAQEVDVDIFASGSVGQSTLEHLSGSRIVHDGRLGAGVGVSYFFTRNIGAGVDAYTENAGHSFVDSASVNLIARFPLGHSGFAPYLLGGGGHQFDPESLWFAQAGAGMEFRFTHAVGIFIDGRYVFTDGTPNYGLFRGGLRLAF